MIPLFRPFSLCTIQFVCVCIAFAFRELENEFEKAAQWDERDKYSSHQKLKESINNRKKIEIEHG